MLTRSVKGKKETRRPTRANLDGGGLSSRGENSISRSRNETTTPKPNPRPQNRQAHLYSYCAISPQKPTITDRPLHQPLQAVGVRLERSGGGTRVPASTPPFTGLGLRGRGAKPTRVRRGSSRFGPLQHVSKGMRIFPIRAVPSGWMSVGDGCMVVFIFRLVDATE